MNPQDIYDKVKSHLLAQNKKSKFEGLCLYRSDDGRRCAVGCLIPDSMYRPSMEAKPVGELFDEHPEVSNLLGYKNLDLLKDLQSLHDGVPVEKWAKELSVTAQHFNLKP